MVLKIEINGFEIKEVQSLSMRIAEKTINSLHMEKIVILMGEFVCLLQFNSVYQGVKGIRRIYS